MSEVKVNLTYKPVDVSSIKITSGKIPTDEKTLRVTASENGDLYDQHGTYRGKAHKSGRISFNCEPKEELPPEKELRKWAEREY